jgi:phage terminase small subunit
MAGVKGRSGGPRKNAGGARPGAGRKPKAAAKKSANAKGSAVKVKLEGQPHGGALKRTKATTVPIGDRDMLQLLQDIALGKVEATGIQVKAAVAAVQYTHAKKGESGKKEEKKAAAGAIAGGRFAPTAPPPRIRAN